MELDTLLVNSGAKYRKEILAMPIVALLDTALKHMTLRRGVRGDETVGGATSGAELKPYKSEKGNTDTSKIIARTLTTYLGDVVEEFDPYQLFATVFGEQFSDLTKRTDAEVVKALSLATAKTISKKLGKSIWTAERDPEGTTTATLFNGFDTITARDIAAGKITAPIGNLKVLDQITEANIGDILLGMYDAASDELIESDNLKLFLPRKYKRLYEKWCQAEFGAAVYNSSYNKNVLHGTEEHPVEIVSLSGMGDTYFYLSTKENMLVGCDQTSSREKVKIRECDNPKLVQFFMCMYFGVEFEFVAPERLMVGQITPVL